ncbi:hypothetical protein GOOTI_034_00180, partial [Gordonia otitidis NBRC 100426]
RAHLDLYRDVRRIGFSRRDILKYATLAAGAMVVAACSGGDPASEPVKKFAQGTWTVTVSRSPSTNPNVTSEPTGPQTFQMTIADGTYTATDNNWVPTSGTWTWNDGGTVQIAAKKPSVATGVPDTIGESKQLAWQYGSDRFAVQASCDSGSKTLTLIGADGDGNPLPITAVKQ